MKNEQIYIYIKLNKYFLLKEAESRSRRRNACVTATMTTELSPLQKRTFSSIIRRECSLDSPASDSGNERKKRKNEQKLANKGQHFIAQFRLI